MNGIPSYINYLYAIHSWNLVSMIKENYKETENEDLIVATSFKHKDQQD